MLCCVSIDREMIQQVSHCPSIEKCDSGCCVFIDRELLQRSLCVRRQRNVTADVVLCVHLQPLGKEEISLAVNTRKLWSAHLHPLMPDIHNLISLLAGMVFCRLVVFCPATPASPSSLCTCPFICLLVSLSICVYLPFSLCLICLPACMSVRL